MLRAEFRLSQADVAERVGVSRQTIHAVENDKFAPSLPLAFKIASLFAADINDVFAPDPGDTVPSLFESLPNETTTPARAQSTERRSRPLIFFSKPKTEAER